MFLVQFGLDFASEKVASLLPDLMNTIIELESADFQPFSNVQEMKTAFRMVYSMVRYNAIEVVVELRVFIFRSASQMIMWLPTNA